MGVLSGLWRLEGFNYPFGYPGGLTRQPEAMPAFCDNRSRWEVIFHLFTSLSFL